MYIISPFDLKFTFPMPKYVRRARIGAAKENTKRCLPIFFLSTPSCSKNDTKPNAAGAYGKLFSSFELILPIIYNIRVPKTLNTM